MFDNLPGDKALEIAAAMGKDIYDDAFSPAMKEAGQGLANTVRATLLPIALISDLTDACREKFRQFLYKSFLKVPEDKMSTPDPMVSAAIIRDVINSFDQETVQEMYSNLLASAMHYDHQKTVHPSFPFIISQLGPIDVLALGQINEKHFLPVMEAKVDYFEPDSLPLPIVEPFCLLPGHEDDYSNVAATLCNLSRLGLVHKVAPMMKAVSPNPFDELYHSKPFQPVRNILQEMEGNHLGPSGSRIRIEHECLAPTALGQRFLETCISSPA